MDARTRNSNKQADQKKDLPADTGAEMKLPKAEDEVLGAIGAVEQQLTALRRAHSDHRQAMVELGEKRRELAEATEAMRTRETQIEERGEELESREGELTGREVELAEMRQEIETREQDVAQRAARIEQRESKIAQQAEQLERQEAQVESRGEELESELQRVQRERHKIELTARDLQERAGTIESREADLGRRETVLVQRESEVQEKLARENAAEARLGVVEKSLRVLEGKLKGRELELGERSRALEEMAGRAGALESELGQTRQRLEAAVHLAEEKLTRERKVSEGLRAQMEVADEEVRNAAGALGRVDELESLLAAAREEIDRVRAEVMSGMDTERAASEMMGLELEAERERIATMTDELSGERERVAGFERDIAAQRERAELAELELGEARERLAEAESRLSQAADPAAEAPARAEVAALRIQLDELAASADEEITATRVKAETAEKRIVELTDAARRAEARSQELARTAEQASVQAGALVSQVQAAEAKAAEAVEKAKAAGARTTELEAKLAGAERELIAAVRARDEVRSQLASAGANSQDEADRLRDALTAAVDRITEAEKDAAAARTAVEAAFGEIESLRDSVERTGGELARTEQAVLETEGENLDLKSRVQELEIELEVATAKPRANADEFQLHRRRRLARQRRILRDHSLKIRRATEALRDRLEQCDKVLQKRSELAEAYHAIVEMRQRNAKREVRGGMVFGVIGMMSVLGMVAAASWFVAGKMTPGEYAAGVVIAGEGGPRQVVSTEDMEAWQTYMTARATDPRFLEQAADRMKRRGITTLGTAGELGREVRDRLVIETPSPNQIRLEWRGEGAERTRRILDTYAVALASVSNQERARRTDGVTTVISAEATASSEPLDSTRIETAGMFFGGSTVFTLAFGGFLWRRLSAAKSRFERDSRIDPLMDDSQWELPRG